MLTPVHAYPDNPVLVRVWRGEAVESQHRGSWVLADSAGRVLAGAGDFEHPYYLRSSAKCLQALPLLESGAAERFGVSDAELALCLASHNAEPCHTEVVSGLLGRLGLSVEDLGCGPQWPADSAARRELEQRGLRPTALHNNCSGKHAGFLALARHLGVPLARYLEPDSAVQQLVLRTVSELTGVAPERIGLGLDGCSAPAFRLPLTGLATAFARVTSPGGLAAERRRQCARITAAVAAHPLLIAGNEERLCTDLVRASGGRLFPKIGAEAVYAVGVRDGDRALAVKLDDGGKRGLYAVLLGLLERFGLLETCDRGILGRWLDPELRNRRERVVGRVEVLV